MVRPEDVYTQVKAMVDKFHQSDCVFGDLRPPNDIFVVNKTFLIDFDWAGKYGEAFYLMELGEGIPRTRRAPGLVIFSFTSILQKAYTFAWA
jgi:hypothetical protein